MLLPTTRKTENLASTTKKHKTSKFTTQEQDYSINEKNKLYRKYVKYKDTKCKEETFTKYKVLKNKITELIRISKQHFYRDYFTENNNNLRKIWIGIKEKSQNSINCICTS